MVDPPKFGENVSAYSSLYPMKLVQSMASGLSHAVAGMSEPLPFGFVVCWKLAWTWMMFALVAALSLFTQTAPGSKGRSGSVSFVTVCLLRRCSDVGSKKLVT